jgi:hypothetical protein
MGKNKRKGQEKEIAKDKIGDDFPSSPSGSLNYSNNLLRSSPKVPIGPHHHFPQDDIERNYFYIVPVFDVGFPHY